MTDTLNRFVARVAAGSATGSDLTATLRPLSSAYGHLLISDMNHAAQENPLRTLYSHRGFVGTKSLYQPSTYGTGYVSAPTPESIDWSQPIDPTGGRTGYASLRMGSHAIARYGTAGLWPKVVLKCRAKAPSTYTVGLILCVVRGRNSSPSDAIGPSAYASTTVTATSYTDTTLTVTLVDGSTAHLHSELASGATASGPAPIVEPSDTDECTLWFGAYCNSNSSAALASIAGITCYLVEPS